MGSDTELHENRSASRHSGRDWRREDLRHGYTTSACAAAAAVAAVRALVSGQPVMAVSIDLPAEKGATFAIVRCERGDGWARCGTIKDAGDDPDVTHGAEIVATVCWSERKGIQLLGGEGVGVVTKPGLPVAMGEPAINPGPRRLITQAVRAELGGILHEAGLDITISVPGGRELAEKTLNPRLGIVGGISILGTTGIVRPFSNEAYRASIHVELQVAVANGVKQAVLTTGSRSESYAMRELPSLPEMAFVQVGDHIGYALKQAVRLGVESITISGMLGKLSKVAQGRMQTHVSEGEVDLDLLADVAAQLGAQPELVASVRQANTARHVQTMLRRAGIDGLEARIAQLAAEKAGQHVEWACPLSVLLFDIGGELLARQNVCAKEPRKDSGV